MGFGRRRGKQQQQEDDGRKLPPAVPPVSTSADEAPPPPSSAPPLETSIDRADDQCPSTPSPAEVTDDVLVTSAPPLSEHTTLAPLTPPQTAAAEVTRIITSPSPAEDDDERETKARDDEQKQKQLLLPRCESPITVQPGSPPLLTYFVDGKGRAELTRLIFTVGRLDFVDDLIDGDEYKRRRDAGQLPFCQVPTLRFGDVVLSQSCAIARYAAQMAGLYPTHSKVEAARCDMVVDVWRDLLDALYSTIYETVVANGELVMRPRSLAERPALFKRFIRYTFKPALDQLEMELRRQPDGGVLGSFCACEPHMLCYADLAVFDVVTTVRMASPPGERAALRPDPNCFMDSRVDILLSRVEGLDALQDYLRKKPYADVSELFFGPRKVPFGEKLKRCFCAKPHELNASQHLESA